MAMISNEGKLIVVSETGRFFEIDLSAGSVREITKDDTSYDGLVRQADSKTIVSEISPEKQADFASPIMIMATFVNLKLLG